MEIKRGIKSGMAAGIISAVLVGIIMILLMNSVFSEDFNNWLNELNKQISEQSQGHFKMSPELFFVFMIGGGLISGIISGLIIGIIYAALYNKIFGKNSIEKGIILSLTIFIILQMFSLILATLSPQPKETFFMPEISFSLFEAFVKGYLLGYFWDKFKPCEELTSEELNTKPKPIEPV